VPTYTCPKCGRELPQDALFCPWCGRKLTQEKRRGKRSNGTGSVYKLPSGRYKAVATVGYRAGEDGKRRRIVRTKTFAKHRDAVNALPALIAAPPEEKRSRTTFRQLYEQWLPTHRAGRDTMNCYKAAWRYYADIQDMRLADIDVDDLQECVDNCPHGKATRHNMKTLCGLVYKFGIPRHVIPDNLDLSKFLTVTGESAAHRSGFSDIQIEQIRRAVGTVPGADVICCLIYTGFRPSEFLALDASDYDKTRCCLTGGAKTEAGTNRTVTVSPKIKAIVERCAASRGPLFPNPSGERWELKAFTEKLFYPALEQIGIDNPLVEIAGGIKRHKYSPHSCRHTFATLMKRVDGADKDKLELIGHKSTEMLRYYQDVDVSDLRKITDNL